MLRIQYWNHVDLSWRERLEWAMVDLFNALSPTYDLPNVAEDLRAAYAFPGAVSINVFPGGIGFVTNLPQES
ncbi:MAG: hypothetical protein O9277_00495 [Magnetospirillum sp.]|nr:hypothetical protein [Magnetospirillum sp.]